MTRLILRSFGILLLAAALAMLTVDVARSIAASGLSLTDIGPTWFVLSPQTLARTEQFLKVEVAPTVGTWIWDPVTVTLLMLPASVALTVLGFLLTILGAPRLRRVYAD